jgi:hypothetical protein
MARTSNGISALWFSTSIGTFHYCYWHSTMVPVLVQAFLHLVQYCYRHNLLPGLAFKNGARTGNVISALWFSTGKGKVYYRYWHSTMVLAPVLAFWYFGSVSVLSWDIPGTGIKTSSTNKGNLHVLVLYQQQYHYWSITILKLLTAI